MSEPKAPYYVTLSYDSAYRPELVRICKSHGIKQKDFVQFAVDYFKKTGINPSEPLDVSSQIKTTENRLIGFLKVQDKNAERYFIQLEEQNRMLIQQNEALIKALNSLTDAVR
jgi:hypothetical protein